MASNQRRGFRKKGPSQAAVSSLGPRRRASSLTPVDSSSPGAMFPDLDRGVQSGFPSLVETPLPGQVTSLGLSFPRLPRAKRNLDLPEDGQDLELNGAVPDFIVWPKPGELPAGKDVQIEKAVEVLNKDVDAWLARPKPKLIKASERPQP